MMFQQQQTAEKLHREIVTGNSRSEAFDQINLESEVKLREKKRKK